MLYLGVGCIMVTHRSTIWPLVLFWVGLALAALAAVIYVISAWRQLRR